MDSLKLPSSDLTSRRVAVIGAGAAGLIASRELRREGHDVVVFERSNRVGGLWVYDPNIDSDPLGIDPSRTIVHTSLYESLRTNLPREVMGIRDFPFVAVNNDLGDHQKKRDPRRYPNHWEVLNYLEDFADQFNLYELIRFETEVVHVGLIEEDENEKWVVKSSSRRRKSGGADDNDNCSSSWNNAHEVFDAVVVCSGRSTTPRIAEIPGINAWPGKQIHSHNYRVPEPFRNQVVLVIGNGPSAWDISKEIMTVAKEVHVTSKSLTNEILREQFDSDNMQLHSMIESAHDDGTMTFQDGRVVSVDIILHCTGYNYYFPFLETNNIMIVDDNCVGPLYKQIFPPLLAPGLAFIGVPVSLLSFFLFELESKWVAGVLSGRISLKSQGKMMEDVEAFYLKLEAEGVPKYKTHRLLDFKCEYSDWLAAECGVLPCEEWRKKMTEENIRRARTQPKTFRDEWEDEHFIKQAQDDFRLYLPVEVLH